ncbi:hypothetical protein ACTFIW_003672 [Dictyostelium discoideum]
MLIQGSEKEKFLACLYNREIQKLDGSKPSVKKICTEYLEKYPGPSINTVIGDLTNLRKRKNESGFIILKDAIPNFSEIDNIDNYVPPIDNKKPKIDQPNITDEKLPNPPNLTVDISEKDKEQIITSQNGKKYMLMVVNEKQTIKELESDDDLDIGPDTIETMKSVSSGSSGDADASSKNGSGTQKNPFSLGSECSSENTIILDDPSNLFHKLVKVNSYYNMGNFKNNLSREDIESGISDVVDHRLAKQFQEEVSEYKYNENFNVSDVKEIRASKVVGAEVFYVDYTTLRHK